jgi:hypothetical protein
MCQVVAANNPGVSQKKKYTTPRYKSNNVYRSTCEKKKVNALTADTGDTITNAQQNVTQLRASATNRTVENLMEVVT